MLRKVCLDAVDAEIFQCCIFILRKQKGLQLTLTNGTAVELTTDDALIPFFCRVSLVRELVFYTTIWTRNLKSSCC